MTFNENENPIKFLHLCLQTLNKQKNSYQLNPKFFLKAGTLRDN